MERIRDFAFDHRRPLAAACAALAVLAAVQSLRPAESRADLTVVAHDVASGHVLTADDLTTAAVPADAHPDHMLTSERAIGRRVAGPMRAGEAVTDRRVVAPRRIGDAALSMVRVEDPASLIGLQVGDRVDVVTLGDGENRTEIVVKGAVVATLPTDSDDSAVATVGLTTSTDDALVLADAAAANGGIRLLVRS